MTDAAHNRARVGSALTTDEPASEFSGLPGPTNFSRAAVQQIIVKAALHSANWPRPAGFLSPVGIKHARLAIGEFLRCASELPAMTIADWRDAIAATEVDLDAPWLLGSDLISAALDPKDPSA